MLIIDFWKQGRCSGFDWAHASREYHDPGSNPAVDAICELVVGCLPHSESFFFFKNQHFQIPFDLERTDTI